MQIADFLDEWENNKIHSTSLLCKDCKRRHNR